MNMRHIGNVRVLFLFTVKWIEHVLEEGIMRKSSGAFENRFNELLFRKKTRKIGEKCFKFGNIEARSQ